MTAKPPVLRVTSRNAAFQQWLALLSSRVKRQRAGEFIIQGVRPVTLRGRARLAGPRPDL